MSRRGRRPAGARPGKAKETGAPGRGTSEPLSLLVGQEATRVPELVPIRHGRMAASAFAFYRGAALPMAADLSTSPNTGLNVQLCGDAHLANFGGFASPERDLVFDINDFDETAVGPFEWDVKRLATSLEVAGQNWGIPTGACETLSFMVFAPIDRRSGRSLVPPSSTLGTHASISLPFWKCGVRRRGRTRSRIFDSAAVKAESKDRLKARDKLTTVSNGSPRFLSDPPLLVPVEDVYSEPDQAVEVERAIEGASAPTGQRCLRIDGIC